MKAHPAGEFHQYSQHLKTNSGRVLGSETPTAQRTKVLSGCEWLQLGRAQALEESECVSDKGGAKDTRNMGSSVAAHLKGCIQLMRLVEN